MSCVVLGLWLDFSGLHSVLWGLHEVMDGSPRTWVWAHEAPVCVVVCVGNVVLLCMLMCVRICVGMCGIMLVCLVVCIVVYVGNMSWYVVVCW